MARNWKGKIKLKDLLSEDESPEVILEVANQMIKRLEGYKAEGVPLGLFYEAIDLVERDAAEALECFNDGMSDMYDWADHTRYWID